MLSIHVPGFAHLQLDYLVTDFNGTLAVDGKLIPSVRPRFRALAKLVEIHVLTANTFRRARSELYSLPCELVTLPSGRLDEAKARYVEELGTNRTACIGNGRNDRKMLKIARLAIAVLEAEGAAAESIAAAHIVVTDIRNALDLLLNPLRLVAGLRL